MSAFVIPFASEATESLDITGTEIVSEAAPFQSREPFRIGELRERLAKWLSIPQEDKELIDFCLAVYKSHQIPGDPLWGIIIDASGGGKTELLRSFRKRQDAYFCRP